MKEIFLTKNDTPGTIRRELIEKLDEIFKEDKLVIILLFLGYTIFSN